jgi:hypothetical protein
LVYSLRRANFRIIYADIHLDFKLATLPSCSMEAPWPLNRVDAMTSRPDAGSDIARFRRQLGTTYLAGIFRTPDDLASQVAAAVAAQGLTRHIVDRVLAQTSVAAADMQNFGRGQPLSGLTSIRTMIAGAGIARAIVLALGMGDEWWSTRLFLLSSLLRSLTGVRQLVFCNTDGRFAGMASPSAVADALASNFSLLDEFNRKSCGTRNHWSIPSAKRIDRSGYGTHSSPKSWEATNIWQKSAFALNFSSAGSESAW